MERSAKSAQFVASIEDLLSKILSLLPIKDLLRFKSVSKHWRTLISDPNFCYLRSRNPNPAAAGIFLPATGDGDLNEYVPFSALNSRTFELNFSYPISQSCNGLFLVESIFGCLVYNPTTDSSLELPEPVGGWGSLRHSTLIFEPVKSRHYKVVSVRRLERSNEWPMIEMYSSETLSWEVCRERRPAMVDSTNGVYWNGSVHWLGFFNKGGFYFKVDHKVLEKMPIMPFPDNGICYASQHYFGQCCDHLHLIEKPHFRNPFDVYEMKRDYSEWFVKYRVDLGPVIAANQEMVSYYENLAEEGVEEGVVVNIFNFNVLNVIRGEAEEDAFLAVMTSRKIIRYNLVSKTFEDLYKFGNSRYPTFTSPDKMGVEYIESLCCV